MKISIIIPVYNIKDYVQECILSVMNQSYTQSLECVIVNDCSDDGSLQVVESLLIGYKGNISFKVISLNKNRGLSAARNEGVRNCTGEYVYFLDGDDYLDKNCIQVFTNVLLHHEYDMIIADYKTFGAKQVYPQLLLNEGEYKGNDILAEYTKGNFYMMAWNKLIKKEFLLKNDIQFEEGLIHEDDLWSFLIANRLESMYVISKITYYYRCHEQSIMTKSPIPGRHMRAYVTIIEKMMNFFVTNQNRYNHMFIFVGMVVTLQGAINHELPDMFDTAWHKFRDQYNKMKLKDRMKYALCLKNKRISQASLVNISYILPSSIGLCFAKLVVKIRSIIKHR